MTRATLRDVCDVCGTAPATHSEPRGYGAFGSVWAAVCDQCCDRCVCGQCCCPEWERHEKDADQRRIVGGVYDGMTPEEVFVARDEYRRRTGE